MCFPNIELQPESESLKVTVRSELEGEQLSQLSWLVFATLDSLISDWYQLNV